MAERIQGNGQENMKEMNKYDSDVRSEVITEGMIQPFMSQKTLNHDFPVKTTASQGALGGTSLATPLAMSSVDQYITLDPNLQTYLLYS